MLERISFKKVEIIFNLVPCFFVFDVSYSYIYIYTYREEKEFRKKKKKKSS